MKAVLYGYGKQVEIETEWPEDADEQAFLKLHGFKHVLAAYQGKGIQVRIWERAQRPRFYIAVDFDGTNMYDVVFAETILDVLDIVNKVTAFTAITETD